MIERKSVFSNFIWRFAERCGAQGVKLIVELVLARLLMPDDYGLIALVTVFITLMNVFVDSGLGSALIQKKDADDLDFSSVFYFNVSVCLILYSVLFLSAPLVAEFYGRTELTGVLRVLGIQIIISGVKNVQQAYVSKTMQFKRFFFATLGGTLGAACLGIAMAYLKFGVWALVAQQLFNVMVDTVILWLTVKWRPKKQFSFARLKTLFSFGWKLLVSSLIDTFYTELRQLIIGKLYTSEDLAYYNQGSKIPHIVVNNINTSIDSVLLPAMSGVQDNREKVRDMTRRSIKVSCYIMAPLMMGLAFTADTLVDVILTPKWLFCVPFLRIFCITYMFQPIHTANLNAIKALGRSDLFLKLEIIKKAVGLIVLLATMKLGVMVMAYSLLFTSFVSQVINSWPNKKILEYSYPEQIRDIIPGMLLSLVMGLAVYPIGRIVETDSTVIKLAVLAAQVILGAAVYIAGSKLLKIDSFNYLLDVLKKFRKKDK